MWNVQYFELSHYYCFYFLHAFIHWTSYGQTHCKGTSCWKVWLCKTTTWYDMKTLYLCVSDSHTFTLRGPRVTESKRRVVRPELMRLAEGKPRVPVVQLTIDLQSDLLFELQTLPSCNPSPTDERQILHGCFYIPGWVLLSSFVPLRLLFPTSGHAAFSYSYKVLRWRLHAAYDISQRRIPFRVTSWKTCPCQRLTVPHPLEVCN